MNKEFNDKIVKEIIGYEVTTEKISWSNDGDIEVKERISLKEAMKFVSDVVSSCFALDTDEYLPEIRDFAIGCSILESYAGFELPEDLEDKYKLVYFITDDVISKVDQNQLHSIVNAIDKKIEYKLQSNISAVQKQINEVVTNLDSVQKTFDETFGGLDEDTVIKTYEAIVNGQLEDKLVESYKSEVAKANEEKADKEK